MPIITVHKIHYEVRCDNCGRRHPGQFVTRPTFEQLNDDPSLDVVWEVFDRPSPSPPLVLCPRCNELPAEASPDSQRGTSGDDAAEKRQTKLDLSIFG